jgi:hypothetical protein
MGGSFDLGRAGTLEKPVELALPAARPASRPAPRAGEPAPAPRPAPADPSGPLVAPEPPERLDVAEAIAAVKLARETITRLDVMSAEFIVAVIKLDSRDAALQARVDDIKSMGSDDLDTLRKTIERIEGGPEWPLGKGGPAARSELGDALLQLRRQMDELNPGQQGDLFGSRRLLGVIPVGDRLHSYFGRYTAAQIHLNDLISSMMADDRALAADNAELERLRGDLEALIGRLRQYLYVAQKIEANLSERADRTEATDAARARALRLDLLTPIRLRAVVLNAGLSAAIAAYAAIDPIRRNTSELIRGLGMVVETTTTALRGAVETAQNVAEYKLTLDHIVALAGVPPTGRHAGGGMDIARLQTAFDAVYAALDQLEAWRPKSAEAMKRTGAAIEAGRKLGR